MSNPTSYPKVVDPDSRFWTIRVDEGRVLVSSVNASQFELGDLIIDTVGEPPARGGVLSRFARDIGINQVRAASYQRTSHVFPVEHRVPGLSWNTHNKLRTYREPRKITAEIRRRHEVNGEPFSDKLVQDVVAKFEPFVNSASSSQRAVRLSRKVAGYVDLYLNNQATDSSADIQKLRRACELVLRRVSV